MNFCEDCGAPLSPGVRFCENCGAKISDASLTAAGKNDVVAENLEGGVLYTNLQLLSSALGTSTETILMVINNFIDLRKADGINYELFDVSGKVSSNNSLQEHINLVKTAVSQGQRYLFILGDNKIIPTCVWENMASDSEHDSDVSSDLPFATLDTDSPFNGKIFNFDNFLYVGRLPTAVIMNYMENIAAYKIPSSINSPTPLILCCIEFKLFASASKSLVQCSSFSYTCILAVAIFVISNRSMVCTKVVCAEVA